MKIATTLSIICVIIAVVVWFALRPREQLNPPAAIQVPVSHNITTIKSNQWYSSIYKGLPTSPIFALPIAYKFTPDGLGFSYPNIDAQPNTVFASYVPDFTVGLPDTLSSIKIDQVGDWHIKAHATSSIGDMSAIIGHGLPYSHLSSANGSWHIKAADTFSVADQTTTSLRVTAHNNEYVIVWKKDASVTVSQNQITISGSPQLYVALLDDLSHQQLFIDQADSPVLGTSIKWQILPTTIESVFTLNSLKPSLVALYPHQKAGLMGDKRVIGEYRSIRGPLSLIQSSSFTLSMPKIVPADNFSPLSVGTDQVKKTLIADVETITSAPAPESKSYGQSVWMGKIANLIELADTLQATQQKETLLASAEAALVDLQNWYEYDSSQYSYISKKPEFGNERLNDHHFHYGYPIRLAAVLVKHQPDTKPKIEKLVNELVADIATIDRQADTYPFMRNFDHYEGHSWADGYAQADDGNNQESSSEAINAWYGVYLWANQTDNTKLADAALYLYNAEIVSTKQYWFNIGDIYPSGYTHPMASLVWSGKVDYTTWFGDVTNYKYGIQLLPFTPASDYLQTIPNFFEYEADFLRTGGSYTQPWGELMLVWKSYTSKDVSVADLPAQSEISPLSVLQYLIYSHTNSVL